MYSPVATNLSQLKSDVLIDVNQQRAERHIATLTESDVLDKAAQAKLKDMFQKNYWDHTSPTGEKAWTFMNQNGYFYEKAGENLARGFISADNMTKAWMASPTHKENILDKEYKETGIAVGNGIIDGKMATVSVQLFGNPNVSGQIPNQNQTLVAGEKTIYPTVSPENALSDRNIPFFFLCAMILAFIVFDGIMLKLQSIHKGRKNLLHFRTSLALSLILLVIITLNFAFIS